MNFYALKFESLFVVLTRIRNWSDNQSQNPDPDFEDFGFRKTDAHMKKMDFLIRE
jgi:hypothetical protein